MNMTPSKTTEFIKALAPEVADYNKADIVLCVPFVNIPAAVEAAKGTNIAIGAENVHFEPKGAYTGEISAEMLVECGVKYAIVGHSERRQYFGETDETVNLRAKAAIASGLTAIICVGETLEMRESGITAEIVAIQTKKALAGISKEDLAKVIIAYEPVWAIGTGLTATPEQAEEIHAYIRSVIADKFGAEVAENTSILYGGSCKPSNAKELFANPNVDGGLIGGAALKVEDFKGIIDAFK